MLYLIANYCLKLSIYDQVEQQLPYKLLLRVSVIEVHNIIVIPTEESRLNEARDADNNIIISDSNSRNILPPQLKKMNKVMYGCECSKYDKLMHSSMLPWKSSLLKHLKDISHNTQKF